MLTTDIMVLEGNNEVKNMQVRKEENKGKKELKIELTLTFRTLLIKFRVCSVQTGSTYTGLWFIKCKLRNTSS